jgi:hypothetical protein
MGRLLAAMPGRAAVSGKFGIRMNQIRTRYTISAIPRQRSSDKKFCKRTQAPEVQTENPLARICRPRRLGALAFRDGNSIFSFPEVKYILF